MNLEINPEFLDIEAEFRKNLNFLLVQKKNGLHTSEMISDTIFLGNIPQRVSPEIVNKTDESLNATPSLDTLPSKIQPFIVKTEHLLSIPEEQSSLTESGFETSENSQTEFMSNINETTKLFHSASLRDSRSSFTIFDENMPPTFALASKNPPLSTRNRGSRVQSLASTFEQIFSNIPENQPARLNATRASRGKQDPASIGDASRRPLVNGQSKRQLLQADFSELKASSEACHRCNQIVYPIDRASTGKHVYHQSCLRCAVCDRSLTSSNFESCDGSIFCRPHFLEKVHNIMRSNSSLSSSPYRSPPPPAVRLT